MEYMINDVDNMGALAKIMNVFVDYGGGTSGKRWVVEELANCYIGSIDSNVRNVDRYLAGETKSIRGFKRDNIENILKGLTQRRREQLRTNYTTDAKRLCDAFQKYQVPIAIENIPSEIDETTFFEYLEKISTELYQFYDNDCNERRARRTIEKPAEKAPCSDTSDSPENTEELVRESDLSEPPHLSDISGSSCQNGYILREISDCPAEFPHWVDHSKERNSDYFGRLDIKRLIDGNSQTIKIPYMEILGDERGKFKAYVEDNGEDTTLFVEHTNRTVDLKSRIPNYEEKLQNEMEKARESGQERNHPIGRPPILCLNSLWCEDSSLHAPTEKVHLSFGEASYFDHRLYREVLADQSTDDAKAFRNALQLFREQRPNELNEPFWANCGGGIWIRTNDNYLIISHRDPKKVLDVPDTISYSASGSYDRYFQRDSNKLESVSTREENCVDGTPCQNMKKIIHEEIGIPFKDIPLNELKLVSLGVDIDRFLIQFSYYWECPYMATNIIDYRFQDATSRKEQTLYFIPFKEEFINQLLQNYKFEPGAAFSLMRIRQKYLRS